MRRITVFQVCNRSIIEKGRNQITGAGFIVFEDRSKCGCPEGITAPARELATGRRLHGCVIGLSDNNFKGVGGCIVVR